MTKEFPLNDYYAKIYNRYDLVNSIFTFGLDKKWRNKTTEVILGDNPVKILDLCCGTGKLSFTIAEQDEKFKVTGYDFSNEMLDLANSEKKARQVVNAEFIQGNAASMPFDDETFDVVGITFGFRNLTFNNTNENKHIQEIFRILKKKGKLVILESGSPSNLLVRFFFTIYLFLFLVPLGTIITGNFKAYLYLALSSRHYYTRQQMTLLLKSFGFCFQSVKKFLFGATNLFVATKP